MDEEQLDIGKDLCERIRMTTKALKSLHIQPITVETQHICANEFDCCQYGIDVLDLRKKLIQGTESKLKKLKKQFADL